MDRLSIVFQELTSEGSVVSRPCRSLQDKNEAGKLYKGVCKSLGELSGKAMAALNITYNLTVLRSYGEVMVETRKGNCDVGWAAYYNYGSRERCVPDEDTCRPTSELSLTRAR